MLYLVVCGIAFWVLRARTQFLGDGTVWLSWLQTGDKPATHEPLAQALWLGYAALLRAIGLQVTAGTVAPVSILSGLISAYLVWHLAEALGGPSRKFSLAVLLLITLGSSQLFFGYIESYPPVIPAILWFLLASIRSLRGESSPVWAGVALSAAVAAHLACLFLVPAYLYVVLHRPAPARRKILLVLIPLALTLTITISLGFGPDRWIRTARVAAVGITGQPERGSAPQKTFTQGGDERPYAAFSGAHWIDLANEALLILPIPILIALGRVTAGRTLAASGTVRATNSFLATAAIAGLATGTALVLPVAAAQDWDLFAMFFVPAGVWGIAAGLPLARGKGGGLVAAGIAAASVATISLFVFVNASARAGTARFETLIEPGARITTFARAYGNEILTHYYRRVGDPADAFRHAKALLVEEPTNPRYWAMNGTLYYQQGSYANAIPYFEQAERRGRQEATTWTNYAICLSQVGRHAEALERFRKAVDVEPDRPDFELNLALGLLAAGEADSARAVLDRTIARWPAYKPAIDARARHFRGPGAAQPVKAPGMARGAPKIMSSERAPTGPSDTKGSPSRTPIIPP